MSGNYDGYGPPTDHGYEARREVEALARDVKAAFAEIVTGRERLDGIGERLNRDADKHNRLCDSLAATFAEIVTGRERLDAALRRIEALELEVARLHVDRKPSFRAVSLEPECEHDWDYPTTAGLSTCTKCHASKQAEYR